MKVKMDVGVDIVVCCDVCKADLKARKHTEFGNHLMVEPCQYCSKETEKKELPDGWYLVKGKYTGGNVLREKRGDVAYDTDGDALVPWHKYTVIKKVTMEEVKDIYKK